MASLDWSLCPVVESIPGQVSGAWVFKGTRTPVAVVFENVEDGITIDEVIEQFPVSRDQVKAALEFAAPRLCILAAIPPASAIRAADRQIVGWVYRVTYQSDDRTHGSCHSQEPRSSRSSQGRGRPLQHGGGGRRRRPSPDAGP